MTPEKSRALMTIDVEDWFQVENLRGAIARESWSGRELRVENSTRLILEILARNDTRATFFVLGWIAEELPHLVRAIHSQGHEIACHGHGHELIYNMSRAEFAADLERSKSVLEALTGEAVFGYRAPSFSITDWAVDVLMEHGLRYDSSLFPSMAHDRYGKLTTTAAQDTPIFELKDGFYQVTLSCLPLMNRNVPWAGGGYFRLIPYPIFRAGVRRILERKGLYSFYIHPWEFDPGQPDIRDIKRSHHFRHYTNLALTQSRFARLVSDFDFSPIRDALPAPAAGNVWSSAVSRACPAPAPR
jgi:polysaccharide deacetylase family protein (PEP-CTERM system associated)